MGAHKKQLPLSSFDLKTHRVGILGGSFDPAHKGHLYLSTEALKLFDLDLVVWVVTPQNPLKEKNIESTLNTRCKTAEDFVAQHPQILVSNIEKHLNTEYTFKTLQKLCEIHPKIRFFWIMGADNLIQINLWEEWEKIFQITNVIVFDRPSYTSLIPNAEATRFYPNFKTIDKNSLNQHLITKNSQDILDKYDWFFVQLQNLDISSTKIRNKK